MPDKIIFNFLLSLFEYKPQNEYILIWNLDGHRSGWFKNIMEAAEYVEKNNQNVFSGVGLSSKNFGPKRRCPSEKISALTGFYADIDIKDPCHRKENLPPTIKDAMNLVFGYGTDPSLVINSGLGIQPYWLFSEPYVFSEDGDRDKISTIGGLWSATLRAKAESRGWAMDSVHDLARVLRIPGTINAKNGRPKVLARIEIEDNGKRYAPDDIEKVSLSPEETAIIIKREKPTLKEKRKTAAKLMLSQNAQPPADKLDMLLDIDPKFRATWQKKRDKEFPSRSEYHFSLSVFAIMAGWTDQEAADLCAAWNSRHNAGFDKVTEQRYMALTILKARAFVNDEKNKVFIEEEMTLKGSKYAHEGFDKEKAQKKIEVLSQEWEIPITRIVKQIGSKPEWIMETNLGTVTLEGPELDSPAKRRVKIFEITDRRIKTSKKKEHAHIQMFLDAAEPIWTSHEAFENDETILWIKEYLSGFEELPFEQTVKEKFPFVMKSHWYLFNDQFLTWLLLRKNISIERRKMAHRFKKIGCDSIAMNHKTENGTPTSRTTWQIPQKIQTPMEATKKTEEKS